MFIYTRVCVTVSVCVCVFVIALNLCKTVSIKAVSFYSLTREYPSIIDRESQAHINTKHIYISTQTHTRTHTHTRTYTHTHTHTRTHTHTHTHTHIHTHNNNNTVQLQGDSIVERFNHSLIIRDTYVCAYLSLYVHAIMYVFVMHMYFYVLFICVVTYVLVMHQYRYYSYYWYLGINLFYGIG